MAAPESQTYPGFDAMRVAAIALVTWQHVASLTGHGGVTHLGKLNVGQLGVALFLAVSAFLATIDRRTPAKWLGRRLARLYPAYWIAIAISFLMTWVTGYKSFGFTQFFCQMLGIGLFTHPHNLVNVATWYVSLIITCYIFLFVTRFTGRFQSAFMLFSTILLAYYLSLCHSPWPWQHLLTFLTVSFATKVAKSKRYSIPFAIAGLTSGCFWAIGMTSFDYTSAALMVMSFTSSVNHLPWLIHTLARYSYEYYLVHGIILVGIFGVARMPLLPGVIFHFLFSGCASVLLSFAAKRVIDMSSLPFRRARSSMPNSKIKVV